MYDLYSKTLDPLQRAEEVELIKLAQAGDRRAFDVLIRANIRFVVLFVGTRYQGKATSIVTHDDLVCAGLQGLHTAIERFDVSKGLKLISYAVWWIRASINRHLYHNRAHLGKPVRESSGYRFRNALKVYKTYINTSKASLDVDWMLDNADVVSNIDGHMSSMPEYSLDSANPEDAMVVIPNELRAYQADDSDQSLEIHEQFNKVLTVLERELPARTLDIMRMIANNDMTYEEVGRKYNISKERVRQINTKGLAHAQKLAVKKGLA